MEEEFSPRNMSYIEFLFVCLGIQYAVLLPLTGLVSFIASLIVVIRGRGPFAAAALVLIVAAPILLGLKGCFEGFVASFQVMFASSSEPKLSHIVTAIGMSSVTLMVGVGASVPAFLTAVIGAILRACRAPADKG